MNIPIYRISPVQDRLWQMFEAAMQQSGENFVAFIGAVHKGDWGAARMAHACVVQTLVSAEVLLYTLTPTKGEKR